MSINGVIHHPCGLWAQRRIRPDRVDHGGEKMESPLKLGLGTLLGLLDHLHTWVHIPDYEFGVWVQLENVLDTQDC